MLPPIGERRVDAPVDESGSDDVTTPREPSPEPATEFRQRSNTRDLVALYGARAEANRIDLRPLIEERRERRPTEAVRIAAAPMRAKPRKVGRGTAEHRDAVRRDRATATTTGSGRRGDHIESWKVWRRWQPSVGAAKLVEKMGAAVRGAASPRRRARRVVQGRA